MDTDTIAAWAGIAVLIVTVIDLYRRSRHDKKEIEELRRQISAQERLNAIIRQFAKDYKKTQKDQQNMQLLAMLLDMINKSELTSGDRRT